MDPEYQRFKRKHPSFPGVAAYVAELKRHNVKGAYLDGLMHDLTIHAPQVIHDLIDVYQTESDHWVRVLLLSAIAEARTETAFALFVETLTSADADLHRWAVHGLKHLQTKEARTALWKAGIRA